MQPAYASKSYENTSFSFLDVFNKINDMVIHGRPSRKHKKVYIMDFRLEIGNFPVCEISGCHASGEIYPPTTAKP